MILLGPRAKKIMEREIKILKPTVENIKGMEKNEFVFFTILPKTQKKNGKVKTPSILLSRQGQMPVLSFYEVLFHHSLIIGH